MTPYADDPWSPADNPHAIAVSEGWWWLRTVALCARRIQQGHDPERQVDARLFIVALHLLVRAADMETAAIGQDKAARLRQACQRFEKRVPGLSGARNVLMHFDEYARGRGRMQQDDDDPAAAARRFWQFGYDPGSGNVVVGPYQINVDQAASQAKELFAALYASASAVDPA